jgi:hypothetical protein
MLWTGLMIATLLGGQDVGPQQATPIAPVTVEGARLDNGANTRSSQNPNEVICQTRPVTGSRFNRRNCMTRAQAEIRSAEARRWVGEAVRGGPTTEAALSSGGAPIGP